MSKMMCFSGSLNTAGFSSKLKSGQLPQSDHITYAGTFNELEYQVGPKAQKVMDLHIGFARASNPCNEKNKKINQFLALFLKGSKDGEPRDNRTLNAVIILDISGSMSGCISKGSKQSRLELAKQAIKMFVSKLRPTDSFGIVTFNNQGQVIVKGSKKSEIDIENVFALVDSINTSGGTTLSSGFKTGQSILQDIMNNSKSKDECQNRLVMLTDVGDNSIQTTQDFVQSVSQQNIHTTIVGISEQFRSDICQSLTKIKGFNYFCAVTTSDLKKYLFQNFDWTFFPCSYQIQIKLRSQNVRMFEVYGTPDSQDVKKYNDFAKKGLKQYTITKMSSGFPSQLIIEHGIVKTVGGLILIQLSPQNQLTQFNGELQLSYKTMSNQKITQLYPVHYNFPKHQQFYSDKCLQQAISGFFFVYQTKQLIDKFNNRNQDNKSNDKQTILEYIQSFQTLKKIAPESKLNDIKEIINVLQNKIK